MNGTAMFPTGVTASAVRITSADRERLPAPLRHEPARLEREEPERRGEEHRLEEPARQRRGAGAAGAQERERDERHRAAEPDHGLEREVDVPHVRPVLARERIEAEDLRSRIVEGEDARGRRGSRARSASRARPRRAGRRRGAARRARSGTGPPAPRASRAASSPPAARRSRPRAAAGAPRPPPTPSAIRERAAVERVLALAQEVEGVDAGDGEAGRDVAGDEHVHHLVRPARR